MNRLVVEALASAPGGGGLVWLLVEREEALAREREAAFGREREAWEREREAWQREREAWERERDLQAAVGLRELEAARDNAEELQSKLDAALGHATVRSVLEQVVLAFAPDKSATKALEAFCDQPVFQEYLAIVSERTGFSSRDLTKSAKMAYGQLSEVVHHGSTLLGSDAEGVPGSVLANKLMLYAVSAIFKFSRRDVRFYLSSSRDVIKLPSPPRSPPRSQAVSAGSSASGTPPSSLRLQGGETAAAPEAAVAAAAALSAT